MPATSRGWRRFNMPPPPSEADPKLLQRAAEVTDQSLQPSLTAVVAERWISLDPSSLDAHRAAAKAALALHEIPRSAEQYRIVVANSPRGADAEFAELETELPRVDNPFGARQVADRLAQFYPGSAAALRLQGFAALRADDPAAAARSLAAALALMGESQADERGAPRTHAGPLARANPGGRSG